MAEEGGGEDEELLKQAQAMAEKVCSSFPEAVRAAKLPKVREGILKRLKATATAGGSAGKAVAESAPASAASPSSSQGPPPPAAAHQLQLQQQPQQPAAPPAPDAAAAAATAAATPAPPPPPPPPSEEALIEPLPGIEACGDEPWFADAAVRGALRTNAAAAHAALKINVKSPAEEILRICPGNDRILGAKAVLRLGGASLGGYSENDVAYAYRQLSRALHPDKNPEIPQAPVAFKRLSDAADELRQGLVHARSQLEVLCAVFGRAPSPELHERPQEALFAEATRLVTAVLAVTGEGEVPPAALERSRAAFAGCLNFAKCDGPSLLVSWFDDARLLEIVSGHTVRGAYDCSPKRLRAQFLCLLNRVAMAEATRQNDCVRSNWHEVMRAFPEVPLWRDLLERLKVRVWSVDVDPPDDPADPEAAGKTAAEEKEPWPPRPKLPEKKPEKAEPKKAVPKVVPGLKRLGAAGEKEEGSVRFPAYRQMMNWRAPGTGPGAAGESKDPICWAWVSRKACRNGDTCRYLHHIPEGYDVYKASNAMTSYGAQRAAIEADKQAKELEEKRKKKAEEERRKKEEEENRPAPRPPTSRWARKWRAAIEAILPVGREGAVPATDPEVRLLGAALWRDVAEWAEPFFRPDPGSKFQPPPSPLELFTSEPDSEAQWAFVPVADLLLIVGQGIVGATAEGVFTNGQKGYVRETFAEAMERLGKKRAEQGKDKKPDTPDPKTAEEGAKKSDSKDEADADMEVVEEEKDASMEVIEDDQDDERKAEKGGDGAEFRSFMKKAAGARSRSPRR